MGTTCSQDHEIQCDKKNEGDNLLLLGSESSDTLRILRQMEYQHNVLTRNDSTEYHIDQIICIRKYSASSMLKLCDKAQSLYRYNPINYEMFNLNIVLDIIESLESTIKTVDSWINDNAYLLQIAEYIHILWNTKAIRLCWELVYCSNINISHFMDNIDNIMKSDSYTPSYNDIMLMPYSNTPEISLIFAKSSITIATVNGSKYTSSTKWLQSFDNAAGIIFVVSLNDFDQISRIHRVNALKSCLDQFEAIVNNVVFMDKPIILIFDKYDLFRDKMVNGSSISMLFNEYIDDDDMQTNIMRSLNFVQKQFVQRSKRKKRQIYTYTTRYYGSNAQQICHIFYNIQHIKLTNNLNNGGFL